MILKDLRVGLRIKYTGGKSSDRKGGEVATITALSLEGCCMKWDDNCATSKEWCGNYIPFALYTPDDLS
jgi:hypothetical protein